MRFDSRPLSQSQGEMIYAMLDAQQATMANVVELLERIAETLEHMGRNDAMFYNSQATRLGRAA